MNFPGLETAWTSWHQWQYHRGAIQPWNLHQCTQAIAAGERILVVASTALGDTVLCTPLLSTLAHHLSPKRVAFLVRQPYQALYANDERLGQLLTVRGKFRGFYSLYQQLQAQKPIPRIACIANSSEPDLIPWLWHSGIRGFLRYRTRWSSWAPWFANREAMRPPTDPNYATGHAIENNLAMAQALHLEPSTFHLSLTPSSQPLSYLPSNRLLLHPGASRPDKCWPLTSWAHVAKKLAETFSLKIALTGTAQEKPLAQKLLTSLPQDTLNFAGQLNLPELITLQSRSALFLSGDTGPYHCAVAVGCPSVTLFAPRDRGSSIEACGPYQASPEKHKTLQTAQGKPLSQISPEQVLEKALKILHSKTNQT